MSKRQLELDDGPSKRNKIDDTDSHRNDNKLEDVKYEGHDKSLKRVFHGTIYQQKLLLLLFLKGYEKKNEFKMATEVEKAAKFDDIVFYKTTKQRKNECTFYTTTYIPDDDHVFSYHDLKSENHKDSFSLKKYFRSYLKVISNMKAEQSVMKKFVLCTNARLNKDMLEIQDVKVTTEENEHLDHGGFLKHKLEVNKFNKLFVQLYKESDLMILADVLIDHINKNKKLTSTSEIISHFSSDLFENNILDAKTQMFHREFFEKAKRNETAELFYELFKIKYGNMLSLREKKLSMTPSFINYSRKKKAGSEKMEKSTELIKKFFDEFIILQTPTSDELSNIITSRLKIQFNIENTDFVESYMESLIMNLIKKTRIYLDEEMAEEIYNEIRGKLMALQHYDLTISYQNLLKHYAVNFNRKETEILLKNFLLKNESSRILFLKTSHVLFGAIKVNEMLQKIDQYKMPNIIIFEELLITENLILAVQSETSLNMLVFVHENAKTTKDETFVKNLCKTVNEMNKKMIFITNELKNLPINKEKLIEDEVQISKFIDTSQKELLSKKVNFQGSLVYLKNIIDNAEEAKDFLDMETIKDLINNNEIQIGKPVNHDGCFDEAYYVNRDFKKIGEKTKKLGSRPNGHEEDENIDEEHFFKSTNKYVLITSETTGMGKSTFLSHFAIKMKKQFPKKWVVYIDLAKFKLLLNNSINLVEVLLEEILQNDMNIKDLKIFLYCLKKGNAILIIDGYDDIPNFSDKTNNNINKLLKHLHQHNARVCIASSTYNKTIFEQMSKAHTYLLQPLSYLQQEELLAKIWSNAKTKSAEVGFHVEQWKNFITSAKEFLKHLKDKDFISTPLYLRMLGEMFTPTADEQEEEDKFDFRDIKTVICPNMHRSTNLYQIFYRYVEFKIDKFLTQTIKLVDTFSIRCCKLQEYEDHKLLASEILLNEDNLLIKRRPCKQKESTEYYRNKELLGLISQLDENKIIFVHLTFAEYFTAVYLVQKLGDNSVLIMKTIDEIMENSSEVFKECIFHLLLEKSKKQVNNEKERKSLKEYSQRKGLSNVEQLLESKNWDIILPLVD